jgi:AcrR family transcriptional regulator
MARPITIQNEVILQAARSLFLERGIRATSAAIAARARVSPGILFKRFKTKQALFRAAMDAPAANESDPPIDLASRVGQDRVDRNLADVGEWLFERSLEFIPTLMMAWSDRGPQVGETRPPAAGNPARAAQRVRIVADYLRGEARLGRVRSGDFELMAQTFIGAIWHHAFLAVTSRRGEHASKTRRTLVRSIVQTLWRGIAPEAAA